MRQTITITDLTQMPLGNQVCVTGVSNSGECIRPICSGGFLKNYLYDSKNRLVIRPRARIEFDFTESKPDPPHIEDKVFHPAHVVNHGLCSQIEWENILRNSSFKRVADIYDGFIHDRIWVEPGANTRSIGTLSNATEFNVQLPEWEGRLRYRLSFKDNLGEVFDSPISDLAFRELCYKSVIIDHRDRATVSNELTSSIKNADRTYLRLGLARPFKISATTEPRCYLQVTGIYTFPDYLNGKTFADFLAR